MDTQRASVREEMGELVKKLTRMQQEYYVLGEPRHSDTEYDRLFDRLAYLEERFPEYRQPDSPTQRVGSDLTSDLPEVEHAVPVLSLNKAYSAEEVLSWMERLKKRHGGPVSFTAEEKIDGVSIVLYYREGVLYQAVTRGNGYVGNDVTPNARTIGTLPLRLSEAVDIAVRGEIFLPKEAFESINEKLELQFANPRNLAAGTMRRIKSSDAAQVPLRIFVYEGYPAAGKGPQSHVEMLSYLEYLGFPVNERYVRCRTSEELGSFIEQENRERLDLPYEIDGLVIKVDQLPVREELGYTGHHPRWATAYKFEAPQAETQIEEVDVQIGRTGRVTPVARVKPVRIGGSTVSNVTLHNQDYIDMLELAIGDRVGISKRGDVIPAVEQVVEKNEQGNPTWKMPEYCPSCGTPLERTGAHQFCPNKHGCPEQIFGRIRYFVGRNQMDIDGLGDRTLRILIERGLIRDIADLYSADFDQLLDVEGFGEKRVEHLKRQVDESRSRPFEVVLRSLGIPELGKKAAELLVAHGLSSADKLLEAADSGDLEQLLAIDGFGEKTARMIVREFSDPRLRELLSRLKESGLRMEAERSAQESSSTGELAGQSWCVTGSFEHFRPRTQAEELIRERGGRVLSSVTGKTTHLLVGENPGTKLQKAVKLGVKIVGEEEFIQIIS